MLATTIPGLAAELGDLPGRRGAVELGASVRVATAPLARAPTPTKGRTSLHVAAAPGSLAAWRTDDR